MESYNVLRNLWRVRRPRSISFCRNTLLNGSLSRSQAKNQISDVLTCCPNLEILSLGFTLNKSRAISNAWRREFITYLLIFIFLDASFQPRKPDYPRHHWMVWWELGEILLQALSTRKLPDFPSLHPLFLSFSPSL